MTGRAQGLPEAREFLHHFLAAAGRAGFSAENFGESTGGLPLIVAHRAPERPALSVSLSAGIHGDEPAGPLALLRLLTAGAPDPGVAWTIFPMLNPDGWDAGTRETSTGCDLNRDYLALTQPESRAHAAWLESRGARFDWAVCLHEDWEAKGFYLYEIAGETPVSFGRAILRETESFIATDTSAEIDGMPATRGLIKPAGDISRLGDSWPEALRLIRNHAAMCHTFETPSAAPLTKRVGAHIAGIRAGLAEWLRPRVEDDYVI